MYYGTTYRILIPRGVGTVGYILQYPGAAHIVQILSGEACGEHLHNT